MKIAAGKTDKRLLFVGFKDERVVDTGIQRSFNVPACKGHGIPDRPHDLGNAPQAIGILDSLCRIDQKAALE